MAKILIIEDDRLMSEMYQTAFALHGYTDVTIANSGSQGLQSAQQSLPDAILLDMMMPHMSGLDVLEELKADPKTAQIPVIVFTNLINTKERELADAKGVAMYLIKSEHSPSEVVEAVIGVITHRPEEDKPAP